MRVHSKSPILKIHDVIKPIYYVSRLFCLWPYKYGVNNKIAPLNLTDKSIATIFATATTLAFIWATYKKIREPLYEQTPVILVTDVILCLNVNLFATLSLFLSNFHRSQTNDFFLKFSSTLGPYYVLLNFTAFGRLKKKLLLEIIFIVVLVLILTALDSMLYSIITTYEVLFTSGNLYVNFLMMVIVICQINCKLELLRKGFRDLNDAIVRSSANVRQKKLVNSAKEFCQVHAKLCGFVQQVNDDDGWQLVGIFCCVIPMSLNCLCYLIQIGTGTMFSKAHSSVLTMIYLKEAVNVALHGCLLIALATKASSIKREALRTGFLANEIVLSIDKTSTNEELSSYREQLLELISQISFSNPHFSAAGIFVVDNTVVSTIIGAITSYFIVCLQFMNSSTCDKIPIANKSS